MFCKNCGAAVVGRYCSCCGTRVRSELEEYRAVEKKQLKSLLDNSITLSTRIHHLALCI